MLGSKKHSASDSLAVLTVDLGENRPRAIVAKFGPMNLDSLVGARVVVAANLKTSKIAGVESHGMVLTVSPTGVSGDIIPTLLKPPPNASNGDVCDVQGLNIDPDECLKSKGAVKCFERVLQRLGTDTDGYAVYKQGDDMPGGGGGGRRLSIGGVDLTSALKEAKIR